MDCVRIVKQIRILNFIVRHLLSPVQQHMVKYSKKYVLNRTQVKDKLVPTNKYEYKKELINEEIKYEQSFWSQKAYLDFINLEREQGAKDSQQNMLVNEDLSSKVSDKQTKKGKKQRKKYLD